MIHFDSEKAMEDLLYETSDDFLIPLLGGDNCFRQVALGPYGICDLILIGTNEGANDPEDILNIELIELKNTPAKIDHISQCARYKAFFDAMQGKTDFIVNFHAHLITLPTDWAECGFCYLAQSIDWLTVYDTKICPATGLELNPVGGWHKSAFCVADIKKFLTDVEEDWLNGKV